MYPDCIPTALASVTKDRVDNHDVQHTKLQQGSRIRRFSLSSTVNGSCENLVYAMITSESVSVTPVEAVDLDCQAKWQGDLDIPTGQPAA